MIKTRFCAGYYCWELKPMKAFSEAEQLKNTHGECTSGTCLACEARIEAQVKKFIDLFRKKTKC